MFITSIRNTPNTTKPAIRFSGKESDTNPGKEANQSAEAGDVVFISPDRIPHTESGQFDSVAYAALLDNRSLQEFYEVGKTVPDKATIKRLGYKKAFEPHVADAKQRAERNPNVGLMTNLATELINMPKGPSVIARFRLEMPLATKKEMQKRGLLPVPGEEKSPSKHSKKLIRSS